MPKSIFTKKEIDSAKGSEILTIYKSVCSDYYRAIYWSGSRIKDARITKMEEQKRYIEEIMCKQLSLATNVQSTLDCPKCHGMQIEKIEGKELKEKVKK